MAAEWEHGATAHIEVDGKRLEYACWGPPPAQAPTIVMLHEGLGSVGLWRDFPAELAEHTGLGVMAYSRAGYGGSDPFELPRPLDYMTREATQVLGPVLDRFGIEDAILLGHSDGATICAIYAGSVSDMRVRGLVLIAPHFFTEPDGLAAIREAGRQYEEGDLRTRLERHHDNVDNAFRGWHDAWTDPKFAAWNVADVIDHWRIPVLAIQGLDDPYGTKLQIEEIDSRIYSPLETLLLPDCGHAPQKEKPEQTREAIAEFTARLIRLEREAVPVGR
ncbi:MULTISPECIES: alpha/beta fold hydrolase [unclassified Sulfitobacter]|uniref:alpha/beta fold hydrolase n=2 Tax=Sulfitobacter TaxID=60136 RepID=UPI0007C2326F|nr:MULTISPECIES: alpha/beta hydrolase [unclassified Sulfitobacter]KZX94122.1 alpha/beta hydrolase [Sulfitobacter sp. HI0023]KZY25385.1 alpha/beta hydrolase [Sulfitobacter sp. HI0040]KZZ69790.1 alpha/beta hydrolase [Sulfitobacter sp. HI0129]